MCLESLHLPRSVHVHVVKSASPTCMCTRVQAAHINKRLNMYLQNIRQHTSINQFPGVMYACYHDMTKCHALHCPYACMQAAQVDERSDSFVHDIR